MAAELKRFIIGRALRTEQAAHERLSKKTALAVFSSDALSSTAYATEEILLVLAVAAAYGQAGAFKYVVPISIGIGILLCSTRSLRLLTNRLRCDESLQLHDIDSELANTFGSFLRRHGVIVGVTLTLEQHPGLSLSPFSA